MDFTLTSEQDELVRTLRGFAKKELAPRSSEWDRSGRPIRLHARNQLIANPDPAKVNHLALIIEIAPLQPECFTDAKPGHGYKEHQRPVRLT